MSVVREQSVHSEQGVGIACTLNLFCVCMRRHGDETIIVHLLVFVEPMEIR